MWPTEAARQITGAQFLGSEPGGWLRYLIDTGQNAPWTANVQGVFGVRISAVSVWAPGGGGQAAGEFLTDLELDSSVVLGTPTFVPGAPQNLSSDPKGRLAGYARMYILLRVRPTATVAGVNFLRIDGLNWAVYRIT